MDTPHKVGTFIELMDDGTVNKVDYMYVIKRRGKYLKSESFEWSNKLDEEVGFWNIKDRADFHIAEYEDRLKGAKVIFVKIITPRVQYQEM